MGSTTSIDIEKAEKVLKLAEILIPFNRFDCDYISELILDYEHNNKISLTDWHWLIESIYYDDQYKIINFFNTFTRNSEGYSAKSIYIAGVLLSKGKVSEKCLKLFEYYDKDKDLWITKNELYDMISNLISICINNIPLLIEKENKNLVNYINTLKKSQEACVKIICNKFKNKKKEKIFYFDFLETFEANKKILTPSGIRETMNELILSIKDFL
jgi:Ca2+-binding EF-hand superfamily protein